MLRTNTGTHTSLLVTTESTTCANSPTTTDVFDTHVAKACQEFDSVPTPIKHLIFCKLSFEECLDAVANRIIRQYHESFGGTQQIDVDQVGITEDIITMIKVRFDRSLAEITEIVHDLWQFKLDEGEYNSECPMLDSIKVSH